MGKANFGDEFKRDAVAQITEPRSATLELNDPDLGRVAARRFDADRVSAFSSDCGWRPDRRTAQVGRPLPEVHGTEQSFQIDLASDRFGQ